MESSTTFGHINLCEYLWGFPKNQIYQSSAPRHAITSTHCGTITCNSLHYNDLSFFELFYCFGLGFTLVLTPWRSRPRHAVAALTRIRQDAAIPQNAGPPLSPLWSPWDASAGFCKKKKNWGGSREFRWKFFASFLKFSKKIALFLESANKLCYFFGKLWN